ncbi:MAG: glycosyltransferase [Liquorilactobacillus ghanensis]|uniref:glycosyltransferase family 4 protein n=1 Tax=Liquorilactobacillus ghanensis TaxID=399370 RepID=UPI0039E86C1F
MSIGVYAFNGTSGHWKDVELTKDCGVVPYLLHKKYGYQAVMVTTKDDNETYSSLIEKVPGIQIDYLADSKNFIEAQMRYLKENYAKIDLLLLRGPYTAYFGFLRLYRKLRPDGKVYIALDANSLWMDRIDWQAADFQLFLSQCDVIATSSRVMQHYLSIKWPFKIEYIPNGFYNFADIDLHVDFKKKYNTILTVGRIGTIQKNNQLLLDTFATIADQLPTWNVRLVGPIQPEFENYLRQYFMKFPALKKRIVMVGELNSKADLMKEYQQAKIFTLTSQVEGGTPNVIAESLFGGCYQVLTNFDAASEAIDQGNCGVVVKDQTDLAQQLLNLCQDSECLLKGQEAAIAFARRNYDFNQIIQRLHYLLFGDVTE